MDIRCRKTRCIYNDRYTCKAKDIVVRKNCECGDYQKGNEKAVDKTKWLFTDNPPVYALQRDTSKMKIGCKADCLFNCEGKCVANGITLNDIKEKPMCVTFLKR
ncbi:MAG: hypothetical protein E7375_00645 [Clostridiales bacterium]|nr:hypothetical protein [Clostridiales bacterium]